MYLLLPFVTTVQATLKKKELEHFSSNTCLATVSNQATVHHLFRHIPLVGTSVHLHVHLGLHHVLDDIDIALFFPYLVEC